MIERLSLRESLEQYAARAGMRVHDARPYWRAEALRLLNLDAASTSRELVSIGLCAIAPGVAVPTAVVDWPDDGPAYAGVS